MGKSEKDTALFMGLVLMFHNAAMQHMGKVKNPLTDSVERDLEQAQFAIDTLDMVEMKTKGNLTDEESRLLTNVLRDLKLNFVDEKAKGQGSESGPTDTSTKDEKKT
ncbi:MAG: DUF1844 domain-containing protein [Ignavibacteria bacterium]|nr:DUF1844 domain-containing protein [Ignavibacteria bacterium]